MSKPENIGTSALMTIRSLIGPFEVRSPPIKKHKVAGHLVPTLQTTTRFFNVKRRRITIEILSPLSIGKAAPSSNDHHDSPHTGTLLRGDLENEVLNDHDKVVFRIFRLARKKEQGAESNGSHDLDDNDGGR